MMLVYPDTHVCTSASLFEIIGTISLSNNIIVDIIVFKKFNLQKEIISILHANDNILYKIY